MLEACRRSDAVLLGAVGGPKWDTTDPDAPRPEQGLLGLRKGLGLYANLRPVRPSPALVHSSPLRADRIAGTDLLVVRELTGGIYFGDSGRDGRSRPRHLRVLGRGDRAHRRRRLRGGARPGGGRFEGAASDLGRQGQRARDLAPVARDGRAASRAATPRSSSSTCWSTTPPCSWSPSPARFDVILTENMFGDILSDEAAMLTGSLGMLPSASLGAGGPGLFEPVHGSAPDIAGKGIANPLATFLSVAMMLRHGLDRPAEAASIEAAVEAVLQRGLRTPDLAARRPRRRRRPRSGPRRSPTRCSRSCEPERGRPVVRRSPFDRAYLAVGRNPETEGNVEKSEWIWMNGDLVPLGGRQGPRAQPRPPLRQRGVRGHPLLRDRAGSGGLSALASTSSASASRRRSTTWSCPTRSRSCATPPTS